jgi:hypothetical protein
VDVEAERDVTVGATIGNATAVDAPPPPPAVGLNTVICAEPMLRMSVAGTTAVSCCVVPMNVVGRFVPFHCTSEHGKKLFPVTFIVIAAVPAVAFTGSNETFAGTGSAADAATEKLTEFETVAPVLTVIGSVAGTVMSVDEICAVSCVELPKVVGRGELFQFTTELLEKFTPVTVSIRPDKLHAVVEEPVTVVITGATIANGVPPDVPPPGPGLNTTI